MNNTKVLRNIIENLKNDRIDEAYDDCGLLPETACFKITDALNDSGPEAAITVADRMLGNV